MRVRDYRPNTWFLIEADGGLILDVNCSHTVFSYSFSMILNQAESDHYLEEGADYLDRLAESINSSAPIAKESNSIYASRKLDDSLSKSITEAIANWRSESRDSTRS